tara:strand:- start:128 stop:1030 length:903 start_codon:yes stop_codon:yes gene_type:complete
MNLASVKAYTIAAFVSIMVISSPVKAQDRPFRDSFILMSPAERHNIQHFLSAKGLYLSDIDGLWGAGTEASVLELQRVYPEQYAQFDINTVDGAAGFLKRISIDFVEEYPEGGYEGEPEDVENGGVEIASTPIRALDLEALCDGYAAFLGLCWNLSIDEMKQVAAGRGFKCGEPGMSGNEFLAALEGRSFDRPQFLCRNPNTGAAILIYDRKLSFDCQAFNTCHYTVPEMAQLLVDEGYLYEMVNSPVVTGSFDVLDRFCGRVDDGQQICVGIEQLYTVQNLIMISLDKGVLGQPGASFN